MSCNAVNTPPGALAAVRDVDRVPPVADRIDDGLVRP